MSAEVVEYVRVYFRESVPKNSECDKGTRLDAGPDRRLYRDLADPLTLHSVSKSMSVQLPWVNVAYAIVAPPKSKKAAE